MFFLNEKISYAVIDFDFLEDPVQLIESLQDNPITVTVIAESIDADLKRQLKSQKKNGKINFQEGSIDSSEELLTYLSERLWTFHDIFITGDGARVSIANEVAIGTILVKEDCTYNDVRTGPDLLVTLGQLKAVIENDFFVGNSGEIMVEQAPNLLPGGGGQKTRLRKIIRFLSNHPEFIHVYTLGRLFLSNDPFLKCHLYSKFIKVCKGDPNRFKAQTSALLKNAINHIISKENLTSYILTHAPSKPDDDFDRNAIILQNLHEGEGIEYTSTLECPESYTSQKDIHGPEEKRRNVEGQFSCIADVEGRTVILFDDVYTSGSTLAECANILLENGATKVIPITLGTVCLPTARPLLGLTCSECGTALRIVFRKRDGRPFWSCANYTDPSTSHTDYSYANGVLELRKMWNAAEENKNDYF